MSLANFFDKAALGASTLLKQFDPQIFADTLQMKKVGVYFDIDSENSSEARIALDLLVNLLARLYPCLAIERNGTPSRFRQTLIQIAQEINPQITIQDHVDDCDICLVVGKSTPNANGQLIYVGSNAWIALISTQAPVEIGNSDNPFGAAAAACLAAANVFRFIFRDQLDSANLDKSVIFSLVDLDPKSATPDNPPLNEIDVGSTHFVGLGAIGNGAVWILRKISSLKGVLHLIDHEKIELTNLQRYVLTRQTSIGNSKTVLAAVEWSSALRIEQHQLKWDDYLENRSDWNLERVVVAVDSAEDRCAVQSALPKSIINGWTRSGNLGISRHSFLGDQACLACLYLPDGIQKNEDQLIAEALGLPNAAREIRLMIASNIPVSGELISQIAAAHQIDPKELSGFEGKQIRSLYTEAVCGGIFLRLSKSGQAGPIEVPMAFQSAFAGILLAAELIISAGNFRTKSAPTITQINLLKPLGEFLFTPSKKDSRRRCICQDSHYIAAYQRKYSAS